jgi:ubiquinone/menaquinone biosynthesis C-methylase UbiE
MSKMKQFKSSGGMDMTPWLCGSPPNTGQRQKYPGRFLFNLQKFYPTDGKKVLSMFAGTSDLGMTTDFRKETNSDIIAPFDKIPIRGGTFDIVIADPPYTAGFGFEWSKDMKDLPKPKHVLKEAARLTKVGGLILILHILVIPAYKEFNVTRAALHPVLCGPNNVIRVLNVFRKMRKK